MKEADAQRAILDWLSYRRIFHWRNNTGAMFSEYKGTQRFMRFGSIGSPDIFALTRGICVGIEVKGPKGKQSDEQRDFQVRFETAGGVYVLAYGIDQVEMALNGLGIGGG